MRILTWNVWWRFGDWRARQEAVLAVLRREQPDVCLLQEVWWAPDGGLAQALAAALGFEHAVAASGAPDRWRSRSTGEEATEVGSAILSRWPLTRVEREALPAGPTDEGRFVLHAAAAAPTGDVPVFCVHLQSDVAGSATRSEQVRHLVRYVSSRSGGVHPAVVGGDMNAAPEADEIRLLEGVLTAPAVPGVVLIDAWRYAEPGDPGLTWDRRHPYVASTGYPSARVDYVLVAPPGEDGRGAVRGARLVGDWPEGGVWPSDHFGVLVELDDGRVAEAGHGGPAEAPERPGPPMLRR